MIVEITKDSSEHGVIFPLVGEFYKAKPYRYDSDKVTLIYQVNQTGKKLDKQYCDCSESDPLVNEYRHNLRVVS